jgi:hypothetical protein
MPESLFFSRSAVFRSAMVMYFGFSSLAAGQQENPVGEMTAVARAYLAKALDAMEKHSLRSREIDWTDLRSRAFEKAAKAQNSRETYDTIRWAITELADGHSFFLAPPAEATPGNGDQANIKPVDTKTNPGESPDQKQSEVSPKRSTKTRTMTGSGWVIASTAEDMCGELISRASDGSGCRVGYVLVPSFGGEDSFNPEKAAGFAKQLHDHVRRLDEMGASAWIVDLRFNSGGNMWPMLAGVGPLLNSNRIGAFVREGEEAVNWEYSEGRAGTPGNVSVVIEDPHTLGEPNAKLVVLIGKYCTSSGEAMAVAFRGRENTRFLGKPTGGATTSTQTIWMGDGAMLFVTNAVYADRTGTMYGGKVTPDQVIAESPEELVVPRPPLVEDPGISAALDWLHGK